MKSRNYTQNRTMRRVLAIACTATFAGSLALPRSAAADRVTPPPAPAEIQPEQGHKAFLMAHAFGTQNYICLPSGTGFAWTFFAPQATLFNQADQQVVTHFLSPNPSEDGTPPRVTWQHSRDTSSAWGAVKEGDSVVVDPTAIPWLLVTVVGAQDGPTGAHKLTPTTFIQRVNTVGGIAPSTGCAAATDVGRKDLVPYEADYVFYYKPAENRY